MKKLLISFVGLGFVLSVSSAWAANRDILWNKVHNQCEPSYINNDTYTPCSLVDKKDNYVIYKVDNDKYQYLLLPTDKITGIEDKKLLQHDANNYLFLAWDVKELLAEKLDRKIKEKNISLTLNSINSRSQDQLHIHISCLAPSVRKAVDKIDLNQFNDNWHPFPEPLKGHSYNFKKLSLSQFKTDNLFQLVNDKVTADGKEMKYSTMAVINTGKDKFLLLEASGSQQEAIGAETLQDHSCADVE